MVIIYESKTGHTKKYAEMLRNKTGFKIFSTKELSKIGRDEPMIFMGWMMAGTIKGLRKVQKYNVQGVCACGTGRTAEPSPQAVIQRNKIADTPFFYLRGGCKPLKEIKGLDRIMLSMFVNTLKRRKEKTERIEEAIHIIENGYDGVREENLAGVLNWLDKNRKE